MMKRSLGIFLALVMMLSGTAFAVEATDAPGTPTQDVVLELTAVLLDEDKTPYDLQVLPADQLTVDTVTDIYKFVYEENHRPVRYFPEETQEMIEEMLKNIIDPDVLYMTEFMRLHAAEWEFDPENPTDGVHAKMLVDVDYQPGQFTLVVLGDTDDPEDLKWTPVHSEVTKLGLVEFTIPEALMEEYEGEDVLFSLLTVRKGNRGGVVTYEEEGVPLVIPSKTAYDGNKITKIVSKDGTPLEDDFELLIVEESESIRSELARIRDYLTEKDEDGDGIPEEAPPLCTWFEEDSQNEIQMLLENAAKEWDIPAIDKEELVTFDYLPLITKNYKDTYGDVISAFRFRTPYEEGQQVVTMLGLPHFETVEDDESLMTWAVQRAEIQENGEMEIVFDQLALIGMGEETGLLMVLCEPFEEVEEDEE